jgi:hypothetical protein
MKTQTRLLRSLNLGAGAHRPRVGERQTETARHGGASRTLKKACGPLALVLAMSASLVHAQTPVCAAPGCNSVASDKTSANTAMGTDALLNVTIGAGNTASGIAAGINTTSGLNNTASGAYTLYFNTIGSSNTASGFQALFSNTTGNDNTASGNDALFGNTTGNYNTATGSQALAYSTTASNNSAVGYEALFSDTDGANNTAFGASALYSNTTGKGNAAQGVSALFSNTIGIRNVGIGTNTLYDNTTGSYNIALGFEAGYHVTTGSNNIEIGALGTAGDNGTIQIGVQDTQTRTTIAGIYGTPVTGSAVYVTSAGQLGVLGSSERLKTDIATMPAVSAKLAQLRPVTFHYKSDPKGARQYGLIAEEVDQIYPELVIRDQAGKIQGVHYEELAPMLLAEVQKQQTTIKDQAERVDALSAQNEVQADEIRDLKKVVLELQAGLFKLQAKDELVAQR